jgi:hypothetical protein
VNISTPVVSGWNDITIASKPVVKDNYYWLSYNSDVKIGYYYSSGGTLRYKTATYSSFTFPDPAGSGFTSLSSNGLLAGWGFAVPPTPSPRSGYCISGLSASNVNNVITKVYTHLDALIAYY